MASCDSCGAAITWVVTQTGGKRMPVDAAPSEKGNLALVYKNGGLESRAATPEDKRLKRDLYTSHFATCPHASKWRNTTRTT